MKRNLFLVKQIKSDVQSYLQVYKKKENYRSWISITDRCNPSARYPNCINTNHVISTDGMAELMLIQLCGLIKVSSLKIPAMYRIKVINPPVHPALLHARRRNRITLVPCSMAILENRKVSRSLKFLTALSLKSIRNSRKSRSGTHRLLPSACHSSPMNSDIFCR